MSDNGYDKFKQTGENLKHSANLAKVNESKELAEVKRTLSIKGLEDVPTSIIPLPFYKLVQPGSTNVTLSDGKTEAAPGTYFMSDAGQAVSELKFYLIRAKRQVREFNDDNGVPQRRVSMGIVGINQDNLTPFMMSLSVTSFSNFGRGMKQLRDKSAECAWDYMMTLTSEKREEKKMIQGSEKSVKYYVAILNVTDTKTDDKTLELLNKAYLEFAASLDRDLDSNSGANDSEDSNDPPFV